MDVLRKKTSRKNFRGLYKRPAAAVDSVFGTRPFAVLHGDCLDLIRALPDDSVSLVVTSPPYCIGKEYEFGYDIDDFLNMHRTLFPEIERVVKPGGSVCWQVGYHVRRNAVTPLDYLIFDVIRQYARSFVMRNRIIWHFGHGQHCDKRFSGRHETILWFTKGDSYNFNLDSVRVPQLYPGKKASKGPRIGEYSGNPLGKNPSDVWDIPNVKANHIEKLGHPCQFPVALVRRLVRALSGPGDLVLDPFSGVASTGVAALLEKRRFIGAELIGDYVLISAKRLGLALKGEVEVRLDVAVQPPDRNTAVAQRPQHFWVANGITPAGNTG